MSDSTIHQALCPRVAVLSSPDVDRLVQLNGLAHLSALLRPFESSAERISVRTSQLETRLCQRFPLRFDPYSTFATQPSPLQPDESSSATAPYVAKSSEEVLDAVSAHISANAKKWDLSLGRLQSPTQHGDDRSSSESQHSILVHQSESIERQTPWFAHFRDAVLQQRFVSRHETFGHPLAILLAVSSASPDPMNEFARLYEITSSTQPFASLPFVDPNPLRYYLLLHDVHASGPDLSQSLELLDHVKKTYGLHCCLLPINSAQDPPAQDHQLGHLWEPRLTQADSAPASAPAVEVARYLDQEDVKRLKGFIRELAAQSLVPFIERCVQQLNEQLANSRKGLTNRLFGASRKLFGAAKAAVPSASSNTHPGYNVHQDFYPHSSVEAQTRRLADLAFTIRDYKLAAAMYELCRKDFAADKAFRHSAGATEMFGLSRLMLIYATRTPPADVDSFLAQACHEYGLKPTPENSPLRATLLYYEAYQAINFFRPASAALERMANASEEVFGALLLEQAAVADVRQAKPALRKCALHLVMAAHRYQACGQKSLSLRCYAQAAALYRGKSWTLIENQLERELGMQAYNDGDADGAVIHLATFLRPGPSSAEEQDAWLRDLLTAYKYSGAQGPHKPALELQTHIFDPRRAKIRVEPDSASRSPLPFSESVWTSLETEFMETGFEGPAGNARKRKRPLTLASSRDNRAAVGATFWLDAVVENPLNVALEVHGIRPRFQLDGAVATSGTAETSAASLDPTSFEYDDLGTLPLLPREARRLSIPIKIKSVGRYRVSHLDFVLANELAITENLTGKKGKRLTATKEQRLSPSYAQDESLRVFVEEAMPSISVTLESPPTSMLLDEECRVQLKLSNTGSVDVKDVRALCNIPDAAAVQMQASRAASTEGIISVSNDLRPDSIEVLVDPDERLPPGQSREVTLLLRATELGSVDLAWLFVFAGPDGNYFTARLSHRLQVEASLEINAQSRPSSGLGSSFDLAIDIANVSVEEKVAVTGISFVSPWWTASSEQRVRFEPIDLEPCQCTRFHSSLERRAWQDRDGIGFVSNVTFTVNRLKAMLQSREIDANVGPEDTKLRLSGLNERQGRDPSAFEFPALRQARRRWRMSTLASQFGALTESDRTRVFMLYEPSDVDLVVHWQTVDGAKRRGLSYVFGLTLGPLQNELRALTDNDGSGSAIRSMYAQTDKERGMMLHNILSSRLAMDEPPLFVEMEFGESGSTPSGFAGVAGVRHDFSKPAQGGLRLPVDVCVRNLSVSLDARFELQLEPVSAVVTEGQEGLDSIATWVGRQTMRGQLGPHSSVRFQARVRVDRPGVVRLGRYTISTSCYPAGEGLGSDKECSHFQEHLDAGASICLVEQQGRAS